MDIIAAHQHGLIEQLEEEVAALAGRPRDYAQRAIVLHHLFDHSRGSHGWALAEARRNLRIATGLAALERRIGRWGWLGGGRSEARTGLKALAAALGEASRARTENAYRAYRLSATKALRAEAERIISPPLLEALDASHAARRAGADLTLEQCLALSVESEALATSVALPHAPEVAWREIGATSIGRAARRLLHDDALARRVARDQRVGWDRIERELLRNPALPSSFRANPAQHFYALQHALAERRRQLLRQACDREPDTVALAA